MAPPKKKRSELSRSAKYYRDNPGARKRKAKTDKKVNAREEQKKKRRESGAARRKAKKSGRNVKAKTMTTQLIVLSVVKRTVAVRAKAVVNVK